MRAVCEARCFGFGPVTLFPLTTYIQVPSELKVTSWGW